MGSISTTIKKGTTLKEFFRNEFGPGVLDVAVPKSNEAYIAYKHKTGPVFCIVALIGRSGNNITYKAMDEGVHPYYYNCPARIFKQLSSLSELKKLFEKENIAEAKAWRTEVAKKLRTRVR